MLVYGGLQGYAGFILVSVNRGLWGIITMMS